MSEPKAITEMWAWVCTEPDGDEGIPAFNSAMGRMPLVGADEARIRSLEPLARSVAHDLGLPVKLLKFSSMEIIETLS